MASMTLLPSLLAFLLAGAPADGRLPDPGAYSPALTRRLTPSSVPEGTYRIYVSDATLEAQLETLRALDAAHAPGEWEVAEADVLGVLAAGAGVSDRARLARLFGGRRLHVARGAIEDGTRLVAYTVVSPHPDATLHSIDGGSLVIVFDVPRP